MKHKYPPGHPLRDYPGPDPATLAICLPVGDFKPDIECVMGIFQCFPFFARPITYAGCSLVSEARNRIAYKFRNTYAHEGYEWSVWIDSDIGFTPQDWCYLVDNNDPFVIAPYSKKNLDFTPVVSGFGFTKVHTKVFEAIENLLNEDKSERAARFFHTGELHVDYFPCGASGNGQWIGEDAGFIMLASLAGFPPRLEHRCRLTHFGRYGYRLPDRTAN